MERKLNDILDEFNAMAAGAGLPKLQVVSPSDCLAQQKNARYFMPEMFKLLVDNVKRNGMLESAPLVYREGEKYRIISGHHRVESAKHAGLEQIVVMVTEPADRDEIVSKQLSHNAIVGKDDKAILAELFNEIRDAEQKLLSGLASEIDKIEFASLNFRLGTFRELVLMFIPTDMAEFQRELDEITKLTAHDKDSEIVLADEKDFAAFAEAIAGIKKAKNIKNNAVAIRTMAAVVLDWLAQQKEPETKDQIEN